MWPDPGRGLPAEASGGGPGNVGAAEPRDRLPSAGHDEDDAVAAAGHLPADRGGDVEVRGNRLRDRPQEILELHREQRRALDVVVRGGIEADVDPGTDGDAGGVMHDRRPALDVYPRDVPGPAV